MCVLCMLKILHKLNITKMRPNRPLPWKNCNLRKATHTCTHTLEFRDSLHTIGSLPVLQCSCAAARFSPRREIMGSCLEKETGTLVEKSMCSDSDHMANYVLILTLSCSDCSTLDTQGELTTKKS